MRAEQCALRFDCQGSSLVGVLDRPCQPGPRGMLVVTGGPQYRAGSHRQFTLLARHLAARGTAVLRFDYRGMGDSEGTARGFEDIDADLAGALAAFFAAVPALREVVLWGLCDGASAAAFYARHDARVTGLVLLNPWVRTDSGAARTTLRHYYLARLVQAGFWRKLASGRLPLGSALASLRQLAAAARTGPTCPTCGGDSAGDLPGRVLAGLTRFPGRILIILSGDDLGAREFSSLLASPAWRQFGASERLSQASVAHANHTFSRAAWRDQVARLSADWMAAW